jgi:3-hydroxybutyryl-CoA dehydrogenase
MAYSLPDDVDQRPVAVDGAGTLGRRIAAVYAAGGTDVRLFDTSADQREAGRQYAEQHIAEVQQELHLRPGRTGDVEVTDDLPRAVDGAWMVIEAVTERIDVKTDVFGELDQVADADAILATNSSSLPSRLIIDKVRHPERVLNTHYYQPPEINAVELMSLRRDGSRRHRRADGQAAQLRPRAVPRPA